jgi:hypothetical protein
LMAVAVAVAVAVVLLWLGVVGCCGSGWLL